MHLLGTFIFGIKVKILLWSNFIVFTMQGINGTFWVKLLLILQFV